MQTTQLVLLLDAEGEMDPDTVKHLLPHEREERRFITYSATGAPRVKRRGEDATPVDWIGMANGVARMVAAADLERSAARSEVEYFVAGWAPLPAFVHLGFAIGAWSGRQTILNRRKDGTWDAVPATGTSLNPRFFENRGLPLPSASDSTGRVAVFVTTIGMPSAPRDAMRQFLHRHGEDLAGIVELRTAQTKTLTADTGPTVAQELTEIFSEIPGNYPHASGIAIFIGGPATLAYLVGRAINPRVNRDVIVSNYDPESRYEFAFRLPWQSVGAPTISSNAAAIVQREDARRAAVDAIDDFRNTLAAADLAPLIPENDRENFISRLKLITLLEDAQGDAFSLTVQKGQLSFGAGLLEALRSADEPTQRGIACLLFLHEIYHFDQNLQSTNYSGVGRAGYALEEVDFWADAFAVRVLSNWELRTVRRPKSASEIATRWIDLTVRGIEIFDRSEQGSRLARLAERRLRRYLTWHMQYVRGETIRAVADLDELLGRRIIVELAPLVGYLDSRFDKYVERATADTQLFAVVGGTLCRRSAQSGFSPAALVDAVRCYDARTVRQHMDFLVGEHTDILAPWSALRIPIHRHSAKGDVSQS